MCVHVLRMTVRSKLETFEYLQSQHNLKLLKIFADKRFKQATRCCLLPTKGKIMTLLIFCLLGMAAGILLIRNAI